MPNSKLTGHYSQAYDAELQSVVERILDMGDLVLQQLNHALEAFINGDTALANQVVETDRAVNSYEVDIDELCIDILVRRQPAAFDLRLILGVLKGINDIERIGDLVEHIARNLLQESHSERPSSEQLKDVADMGRRVAIMFKQALDSFKNGDAAAALDVVRQDKAIDGDYRRIVRHNLTYMLEDPRQISRSLEIMWVVRALERIGDHTRNLCQYTIFLTKGRNATHLSDAEMQKLIENT